MDAKINNILYLVVFSGLGLFSYLLLINYTNFPDSTAFDSINAALFFIIAFNILGYVTIHLSAWINNQYALYLTRRWKMVAIYALVAFLFLLLNYWLLVAAKLLVGSEYPFTFPNGGIRILIIVWLVELVILGLLMANKSIQNSLKLQRESAQLIQENNTARYTALQNQLNPHFLFNSLNTLIAEIEYEPKNAVIFTRNLSDVYRYVLQCQDKPLVTLSDELEFVKSYLFLHSVRLGDCIKWNAQIPADYLESQLPPLTLQLLFENVVKHNTITINAPMKINITIDKDTLVVSNTINLKKDVLKSGIGLENLNNRCSLILGREIEIVDTDELFMVKIPLLYE
ncbi:MAG: histidine kinase [Muribaculaceae bacterium]